MLSLRLKRIGRTGHAQFRLIAQDRRFSPKSGRITAYLGSYNPHTKKAELDVEKINAYLKNGAQPSPKVAKLLKKEGLKLPNWVAKPLTKKRAIRHPEKLRRNRPTSSEATEGKPAGESTPAKEASAEKPTEPAEEAVATEEAPAEVEVSTADLPAEALAKAGTPAADAVVEEPKPAEAVKTEESDADKEPKAEA